MPKISVIIPAYNVEEYIAEMLDCILNQTMRDVEIICINDASTDETLHIMEAFSKIHSQIIVINNEKNQGAAYCRNIGLQRSRGRYICFLDADDLYASDMLRKEYDAVRKYNADMAVVHSVKFKGRKEDQNFDCYGEDYQWKEQCISIGNSEHPVVGSWNIAPWNKLYKKEFIQKYNLHYQDLASANDIFFGLMALLLADRIVLVESKEPMVFHRVDSNEQISKGRVPSNTVLAFEKVHDAMVNLEIWTRYFEEYFDYYYKAVLSEFRRSKCENANRQTYMYIAQEGLQRIDFFSIAQEQYRDQGICQRLNNFLNYSYDGAWFWTYEQLLQRNAYKIILKLKSYEINHQNITIWGAGIRAEVFIDFCRKSNCKIGHVVDTDIEKQGKYISGMEIQKFENVSSLTDVVLVLNSLFYGQIKKQVKEINPEIEIYDFQKYLSV